MADIFLSYEVSINLFIQIIIFLLLSVAFFYTLFILKNYKHNASTTSQYNLEKKSYLVITIIQFFLIVKILLLPFFTYTLDQLSNIIPGAMCAAGVISANDYGELLIVLKITIILSTMLWLVLNKEDLHSKGFRYFKKKLWFFLFIYLLILVETPLELLYFSKITTVNPVSCCSSLYSNDNPQVFSFSNLELLSTFYITYILILLSALKKKRFLLLPLTLLFLYLSYLSITYFFSTYIYQLPSHKCPYCLLQAEYYYIGYFIYSSLFLATFYSLCASFYTFETKAFHSAIIWYNIFILLVSSYVIYFRIVNGVFL